MQLRLVQVENERRIVLRAILTSVKMAVTIRGPSRRYHPPRATFSEAHYTFRCPTFNNLKTAERWDFVKAKKEVCRNCRKGRPCTSGSCKKCGRKHHTLLHSDRNPNRKFLNSNANKPSTSASDQ